MFKIAIVVMLGLFLVACSGGSQPAVDIDATVAARLEQGRALVVVPTLSPLPTAAPLPTHRPAPVSQLVVECKLKELQRCLSEDAGDDTEILLKHAFWASGNGAEGLDLAEFRLLLTDVILPMPLAPDHAQP